MAPNSWNLFETQLKEGGIMLRSRNEIYFIFSLAILVACFKCGRVAWAEPESKKAQPSGTNSLDLSQPNVTQAPNGTTPTNDPLYQAILSELRGKEANEKRVMGEAPSDAASSKNSTTKETKMDSVLSSEDWLAIESILRSAKLLELEAKKRTESNQEEASQLRLQIVAKLRQQVIDLIARNSPARIPAMKAQPNSF